MLPPTGWLSTEVTRPDRSKKLSSTSAGSLGTVDPVPGEVHTPPADIPA
jgi:hypothetical protein